MNVGTTGKPFIALFARDGNLKPVQVSSCFLIEERFDGTVQFIDNINPGFCIVECNVARSGT